MVWFARNHKFFTDRGGRRRTTFAAWTWHHRVPDSDSYRVSYCQQRRRARNHSGGYHKMPFPHGVMPCYCRVPLDCAMVVGHEIANLGGGGCGAIAGYDCRVPL